MDNILGILVSLDYPEKVIPGVRRKTDQARMLVERTRAEVTMGILQRQLQKKLNNML